MDIPNRYAGELCVNPSNCGFDGRLSVYETFRLFMDLANTHASIIGIDQRGLMARGLFWMITKTRIVFRRRPAMQDTVTAGTWPLGARSYTSNRCYTISDGNGILAEGMSEWVVLESKANGLTRLDGLFPSDFSFCTDCVSFTDFPRLRPCESDYGIKGTYTVSSSDIDMGMHMNNTIYIRAMLGLFSIEELRTMDIKEMSVIYRNPAHLGDALELRTKTVEDGLEAGFYFNDGRAAVLAQIATNG